MKKSAAVMLVLLLICCFAACSNKNHNTESSGSTFDAVSAAPTKVSEAFKTETSHKPIEVSENSNILIVYFSRYGNTEYPNDVDAIASASIVADGNKRYGTTEYIANLIWQAVGGDIHRIETVTPYTTDFDELRDVNHKEMQQGLLPKLKESDLNISTYDTVFIGYPVWATGVPQAVLSFLEEYDLSGKTVVPFCTHDGYGAGSSYRVIDAASHAALSPEGIAINAKDVLRSEDTIADWLSSIGVL